MLTTTNQVIDALGGVEAIASLTGRSYDAAWNWTRSDTFPANTFLVVTAALKERGLEAPPSLWRMVEASA